jgi:hypothetical protein
MAATTHHVIPELDRKGLRDFGLVTGSIVAVLFGLFFPWLLERAWPLLALGNLRRAGGARAGGADGAAAGLQGMDAVRAPREPGDNAADPRYRLFPRHFADGVH